MRYGRTTFFLLALCWSATAGAQTLDRGQIRGTIYDPTHAAIPTAQVTLSNDATGFNRQVIANEVGVYSFPQIPTGTYKIVAEFGGFSPTTITDIIVNVGSSLTLDITLQLAGQAETVTVAAESGIVDTSTAGISQLINSNDVKNLPLSGRDYRDLAQLSPSAQIVPGLRGGIRLGGQQSDYTGLVIDGGDAYDNFFGEFFGSLETKNFTIPLDAVQEFQVVSNGFAPEFGRSTGGLLNVVTKSGSNQLQGTGHYFFRSSGLTADDALGTPSNIDVQQQFGAAAGFPIERDKQFLFVAFDRQLQHGPLVTQFARPVNGIAVPELGIPDLASLEGSHEQFQNLFSILGRYDIQLSQRHNANVRSFFTRNRTDGFTGGRGQNQIQASFGNTELFTNEGIHTVGTFNSVFGNKLNELKVTYSWETRPRDANDTNGPEVQINDTGTFGGRFFLPITGDSSKIQIQDNVVYTFGKHDMKFGGDINAYASLKGGAFIGWSRGTYQFDTLEGFQARAPIALIQGFGLNGVPYAEAGASPEDSRQTGIGLYAQDKWQVTPNLTLTYGIRWDGTNNPAAISPTPGQQVFVGSGTGSRLEAPLQEAPDDYSQWGPRVGASYRLGTSHPTIVRAAWGLYYAQIPGIFIPTGSGRTAVMFCFFNPTCLPPEGFPTIFPDSLTADDPLLATLGAPGITYVDPDFKNPKVSNFTTGVEYQISQNWTASVNYAYSHSERLRVGGFSSTVWERNVVPDHVDQFGRTIVAPAGFGPQRNDPTIGSANSLASFGHGNFNQIAVNITRRFSDHYQFFANYSWTSNKDNASTERDSETFYGPQDPFNLDLDYGRNALDITHQFKFAGVAELPWGINLGSTLIARSGLPYPAYINGDTNGDGVVNQVASNDRPIVNNSFLLERYPVNQPSYFAVDMRLSKEFALKGRQNIEAIVEFFNFFNNDNLFSNPNITGFVNTNLSAIPKPGDIGPSGPYRTLDQISPGSTPFAVQLGLRYNF